MGERAWGCGRGERFLFTHPCYPLHSSGLIVLSSKVSYYLQPRTPGDTKDFPTHEIFRMEQLFTWRGVQRDKNSQYKAGMASLPHVPQSRVRGTD